MTSEDYKDAIDAVERGDGSAKTKLAWYMLSGRGGADVDADGAVALLEERVKEGDAEAMWMLGVCCEFGIGTDNDIGRALILYGKSSEGGNMIGSLLMKNEYMWGRNERGKGILRMKTDCLLFFFFFFFFFLMMTI